MNRSYPLFLSIILLAVIAAAPVHADAGFRHVSLSYRIIISDDGVVLLDAGDAAMIDSGYTIGPGNNVTIALKAKAWRDTFGLTNFYGAGIRWNGIEVALKAERSTLNIGLDVYLVVDDELNGRVVEEKIGHFGVTDTVKTWSATVEIKVKCNGGGTLKVYGEDGELVWGRGVYTPEPEKLFWVPWDGGNEAGTNVLQSSTTECGGGTGSSGGSGGGGGTGGSNPPPSGPADNPLDTSDNDNENSIPGPLTDLKFAAGLGIVLVALGLSIGLARR